MTRHYRITKTIYSATDPQKPSQWRVSEVENTGQDNTPIKKHIADFFDSEMAHNYIMMLHKQQDVEVHYVISRVYRDDLESVGFDTSEVDNSTMIELADKLGDAYTGNDTFWADLPIIAESLGIPRRKKTCCQCGKDGLTKDEYRILDGESYCLDCCEKWR